MTIVRRHGRSKANSIATLNLKASRQPRFLTNRSAGPVLAIGFDLAMAYYLSKVWFEVAGGNYRLVVAFDFRRQVAFVKFIATHSEYDRIDPLTVSQY